MTFASSSQFYIYHLALFLNSVLNVKVLVDAFNQEKAPLVGAFSVIVKTDCETDGALHSTNCPLVLLQAHLKCIVEQEGVMSADEAPDTSYYQWVTFMFCLQVATTTSSSQAVIHITFRQHSSISPTSCGLPWRVGCWPALALTERRR